MRNRKVCCSTLIRGKRFFELYVELEHFPNNFVVLLFLHPGPFTLNPKWEREEFLQMQYINQFHLVRDASHLEVHISIEIVGITFLGTRMFTLMWRTREKFSFIVGLFGKSSCCWGLLLRSGICMNTFGMHEIKIHMRPETRVVSRLFWSDAVATNSSLRSHTARLFNLQL